MDNEKIVLAFAKVKEDMNFLKSEITKISKKKVTSSSSVDSSLVDSVKNLEKSIIKIENNYKSDIDKTHKIISKIREEFDEKLNIELSMIRSEFEEKLADIESNNSFEGEDLY